MSDDDTNTNDQPADGGDQGGDPPKMVDTGLTVDGEDAANGEGSSPPGDDTNSLVDLSGDGGEDGSRKDGGDGAGDDGGEPPATVLKLDACPEWLPSNFFNAETGEVDVQALAKSQSDLRKQVSAKGEVPESADGYELTAEEDLAEFEAALVVSGENGEKDPVVSAFLEACHASGIPAPAVNAVYNAYLKAAGAFIPAPLDRDGEMRALGTKGPAIVDLIETKVKSMFNGGVITAEERDRIAGWMTSAQDVRALHKLMESYGEIGIPVGPAVTTGAKSVDELRSEMQAVMKLASEGDPSAQRRYEALQAEYEKTYGTDPAGSSIVA